MNSLRRPVLIASLAMAAFAAIAVPARADTGYPTKCTNVIKSGASFRWTTYEQDDTTVHASGVITITKVAGTYVAAIQTSDRGGSTQTKMYGAIDGTNLTLLLPANEEAWQAQCQTLLTTGNVKGYFFVLQPS